MKKARNKSIKRIIALLCVSAVVVLLAAMPLLARQSTEDSGPRASILSGTVSTGDISIQLIGGGTLAEDDALTVSVPTEVKLKEFLVTNGQTVTEGTPIASVDRVTVMNAITKVQETLEYLSGQIADADGVNTTETVNALAGGIVKILYAQPGDLVQDVMLEHGALAVLSLDGLMAVDLETASTLASGSEVIVTLSDNTEVSGKIVRNLAGEMTVTVEDDDYAVGEPATVTDENGNAVGSGELYIYSPWNATAYAGTVSSIKVSKGDSLRAGNALMVLKDGGYSATYHQLISQRQKYEELMLELFKMYQTETITAPCGGVISGIDNDSAQLLSDNGTGYVLSFLSNAPNGNDEILYHNYIGKVTAVGSNGWSLLVNPQSIAIADYKDLTGVSMDEAAMTQVCTYPASDSGSADQEAVTEESAGQVPDSPSDQPETPAIKSVPIYELVDQTWQQIPFSSVSAGDVLLFAADQNGEFVWIVRLKKAAGTSVQPSTPSSGSPSGNMGGYVKTPEPQFEAYSLDVAEIASVTPQDTMTLDILIDELDMKHLQVGMSAQVKVNALGGEKHTATVTAIGNTGTNNGGNSKYTVELSMARTENMLSGMNATATVVLTTVSDVLTVPADALTEDGNRTIIYTDYDEETQTLINPVVVTIGCSDGETVEILDGLTDGQTYYYAYYDTLEVSLIPDFGRGGLFG